MMSMVSDKIVDSMVIGKIIPAEDRDLYVYGFHQGFVLLANIITTIIVGLFFGMVIESIIFIMTYLPLRSYAGGYHAKTPTRCYFISIFMIAAVLSAIRFPNWNAPVVIACLIVAAAIIVILSPVEDANKPLDEIEKVVYKKRARTILAIELGIAGLFAVFGVGAIALTISVALFTMSIMLVLGKLKNAF